MIREHQRMWCFLKLLLLLFASSEAVTDKVKCSERDLCAFNENKIVPNCYCDNKCFVYNDCCKEYITNNSPDFPVNAIAEQEKCILLVDEKENVFRRRNGAFMIDTCLETRKKCHSNTSIFRSLLPVSYGKVTYLNADCASCNSIDNYKIWSIVFAVSDIEDMEDLLLENGENGTHGNLNRKDTVEQILSRKTESDSYKLLPPRGFTPRYCPFDVWNDIKPVHFDEIDRQNTLVCREILFKNYDLCKRDGCCNTSSSECITREAYDGSSLKEKSIFDAKTYVFFDFSGKTEDGSTVRQNRSTTLDLSVDFQGIQVVIMIEFQSSVNGSFNYDDYIQSTLAYLRATEFRLSLRYEKYLEIYTEKGNVIIAHYASPLRLGPRQANELLQYQAIIAYMDSYSKDQVFISLTATRMSYLDSLVRGDRVRFRSENTSFKPSPSFIKLCNNVSLVLHNDHVAQTVEIECLDKKGPSEKYTAGYSPGECSIGLIMSISLMVFIFFGM